MKIKEIIIFYCYFIAFSVLLFTAIQCWQTKEFLSVLLLGIFALIIFYYFGQNSKQTMLEAEKIMMSISQKDFSLFHEKNETHPLKNVAIDLYQHAQNETIQMLSYKIMYESILNKMEIGFVIVEQKKITALGKYFIQIIPF